MRRATVYILMLAGSLSASATLRVFVTSSDEPYGLDDRSWSCIPTFVNIYVEPPVSGYDCDYFQVTNFPPADYPSGICGDAVGIASPGVCGEPYIGGYIWLQFQNEAEGAMIRGMRVEIIPCSAGGSCIYPTYYIMDNRENGGYRRWNSTATPPDFPEWHQNPQMMVNVTAHGIQNVGFDEPCNLYDGSTHTALLGALICDPSEPGHARHYAIDIILIEYASGAPGGLAGAFFSFFDRGDLNCDGAVDFGDINPFVLILTEPDGWQAAYPDCPFSTGDINADGLVDFADINPFVALLTGQ